MGHGCCRAPTVFWLSHLRLEPPSTSAQAAESQQHILIFLLQKIMKDAQPKMLFWLGSKAAGVVTVKKKKKEKMKKMVYYFFCFFHVEVSHMFRGPPTSDDKDQWPFFRRQMLLFFAALLRLIKIQYLIFPCSSLTKLLSVKPSQTRSTLQHLFMLRMFPRPTQLS